MPRIHLVEEERRPINGDLVAQLARELKSSSATGQPLVYEKEYRTGKIQVTVIWDDWHRLSHEERTGVILSAYAEAEGPDYRERIALASGLTVLEAEAAGMLPFRIITALRPDDRVTLEECRKAMVEAGASVLRDLQKPELRFATSEEADATLQELVRLLPKSEQVWVVTRDSHSMNDWSSDPQ